MPQSRTTAAAQIVTGTVAAVALLHFLASIIIPFVIAFILAVLVTHCMVMPDGGRSMQGQQLPVNPALTPNAPQPRPCPGWFC